MSGFQMPSFMKREPAGESGEHTNVHRLRDPDEVTTQPARRAPIVQPPPMPEDLRDFRKDATGAPPSTLPVATVREIDAATNILEILLEHEGEAREGVVALYETMMELYAKKPPAPDVPSIDVVGHAA